jgi:hypothetical protein
MALLMAGLIRAPRDSMRAVLGVAEGSFRAALAERNVSVDPRHIASALGLCMGSGELIGGALSPFIAGYSADVSALQAPLWIMSALALSGGVVAFGVRETRPP